MKVSQLTELGSTLFEKIKPVALEQDFSDLMQHIESMSEADIQVTCKTEHKAEKKPALPAALNKITDNDLESLNRHGIGSNFRYADLNIGDPQRETSLLNIKAGGNVPRHRHKGDEITVVLKGSFSDQDDHYQVGDFIVRTAGEVHSPVAAQDEDCLCLSTLDDPIQMTNWFYRLLMPFVKKSSQPA